MRRARLLPVGLGLLLLFALSEVYSQTIISRTIVVPPGRIYTVPFSVTSFESTITGRFRVQGGSNNDIEVYVFDSDGLENWKNGNRASTYYNSGRLTVASINQILGRGNYFLVFNNGFSIVSNKVVEANISISSTSYQPSFPSGSLSDEPVRAWSATRLLNVRKGPTTNSAIIGRLRQNQQMTVLRDLGEWTEIRWRNSVGYVFSRHVRY
jgi:uncharacterized protein YgiM (DUF1202 family)